MVGLASLLIVMAGCGSGGSSGPAACAASVDCGTGLLCCVGIGDGSGTNVCRASCDPAPVACRTDADCAGGEGCVSGFACVAASTPSPNPTATCPAAVPQSTRPDTASFVGAWRRTGGNLIAIGCGPQQSYDARSRLVVVRETETGLALSDGDDCTFNLVVEAGGGNARLAGGGPCAIAGQSVTFGYLRTSSAGSSTKLEYSLRAAPDNACQVFNESALERCP